MKRNLWKELPRGILIAVLTGVVVQFFVPGVPNLWDIAHSSRVRKETMRSLKREALANKTAFFNALENDEKLKRVLITEQPLYANTAALESLLNDNRKYFEIKEDRLWQEMMNYRDEAGQFNAANREWAKLYEKKREPAQLMEYKKLYSEYLQELSRRYEGILETAQKNGNNFRFPLSALPPQGESTGALKAKLVLQAAAMAAGAQK